MKVSFFVLKSIRLLLVSALIFACNRSYNTKTDVNNNLINCLSPPNNRTEF